MSDTVPVLNRSRTEVRKPEGGRASPGEVFEATKSWSFKRNGHLLPPLDLYRERMESAPDQACLVECRKLDIPHTKETARSDLFEYLDQAEKDAGPDPYEDLSWSELWSRASDVADEKGLDVEEEAGGRGTDKLKAFLREYEE